MKVSWASSNNYSYFKKRSVASVSEVFDFAAEGSSFGDSRKSLGIPLGGGG
jgi:hypothetical protein